MNENINIINTNSIKENNIKENKPVKLIKTNRAECQHMEEQDFDLSEYIEDDFFNNEKAIKLKTEENISNQKEREIIFTNFMSMVKCLKKIQKKEEDKINDKNEKNFYNYIQSEEFNIDLLIDEINKQKKISIIDTLIELMYTKYINESFFYLPQLCMLFNYKEYISSLESYILDRCVNQIKFSLQTTWLLNSFIEDDNQEIKLNIYESLLQRIEETLVNGARDTIKVFNQYEHMDSIENNNIFDFSFKTDRSSNNSDIQNYMIKECKLSYFDICMKFYSSLKLMCEQLKNYDKENGERKNKLMKYIEDFNQELVEQRIEQKDFMKKYPSFYGIILPFNDSSSAEDYDSNYIVRIIPEECFCFSTKARVPTKICAECVTVKDLKNSGFLNKDDDDDKLNKFRTNKKEKNRTVFDDEDLSNNNLGKQITIGNLKNKFNKKRSIDITRNLGTFRSAKTINLKRNSNFNFVIKDDKEKKKKEEQKEKIQKFLSENIKEEDELKDLNDNNNIIDDFEIFSNINEELKNVFGKPMETIENEIKQNSPYKNLKSYKLINFIAKADDDLRQELLAMQLIKYFNKIFKKENIQLTLHPYEILITSSSSGLLEFLQNTSSIDGIKKKMVTKSKSLYLFYKQYFKGHFEEAQENFTRSLAAYSLICYYLQIKDRHNGNIMIDMYGNVIHIDFGFILGISPGGINFENAPFKLTKEYVEIMGGVDSLYFRMFKDLMIKGMIICKKYVNNIINIAEIMSKGSKMPCFDNKNIEDILLKFRERFYENKKDEEFIQIVDNLVNLSYNNFRTNQYDNYQKFTNGIIP